MNRRDWMRTSTVGLPLMQALEQGAFAQGVGPQGAAQGRNLPPLRITDVRTILTKRHPLICPPELELDARACVTAGNSKVFPKGPFTTTGTVRSVFLVTRIETLSPMMGGKT